MPVAVKRSFRSSQYVSWYVENMRDVETESEHIVVIDVSLVTDARLGGLFKDVTRLYFALDGTLIRTEKVS